MIAALGKYGTWLDSMRGRSRGADLVQISGGELTFEGDLSRAAGGRVSLTAKARMKTDSRWRTVRFEADVRDPRAIGRAILDKIL